MFRKLIGPETNDKNTFFGQFLKTIAKKINNGGPPSIFREIVEPAPPQPRK